MNMAYLVPEIITTRDNGNRVKYSNGMINSMI